jgi:hypothetical protein
MVRSLSLAIVAAALVATGCAGSKEAVKPEPQREVTLGDARAPVPKPGTSDLRLPRGLDRHLVAVTPPGGRLGIAIGRLEGGPIRVRGDVTAMRAWSAMKIPVIVATVVARRAGELPDGDNPTPDEVAAIEAAITRSDNAAALQLWGELVRANGGNAGAARRVQNVLRAAGDGTTTVESEPDPRGFSPFGRTQWGLRAAASFYRALADGRLLAGSDTGRILSAMGRVVPGQRWGVGAAHWKLRPVRLKGGWGPSEQGGYQVLQVGLIGPREDGLVVALAASAPDFVSATEAVSRAARVVERIVPA